MSRANDKLDSFRSDSESHSLLRNCTEPLQPAIFERQTKQKAKNSQPKPTAKYISIFQDYEFKHGDVVGKIKNNYFYESLVAEAGNDEPVRLTAGQIVYLWGYKSPVVIVGFSACENSLNKYLIIVRYFNESEHQLPNTFEHPNPKASLPSKKQSPYMRVSVLTIINFIDEDENGKIKKIAEHPTLAWEEVEKFYMKKCNITTKRSSTQLDDLYQPPRKKKILLDSISEGMNDGSDSDSYLSNLYETRKISPSIKRESSPSQEKKTDHGENAVTWNTDTNHRDLIPSSVVTDLFTIIDKRLRQNEEHFQQCLTVIENSRIKIAEEKTKQLELKLKITELQSASENQIKQVQSNEILVNLLSQILGKDIPK